MLKIKKEQIVKEADEDVRKAILADDFSKKPRWSQFLYTHVPPFSTAQKQADRENCNKSVIAALLFNQRKLAEGVKPISFESDEFPACKRAQK